MSRRRVAQKRKISVDTKYNSLLLSKFINNLMKSGKKTLAEKIIYNALSKIENVCNIKGYEIFNKALNNVKPYLELNSVRIGGANYQVPTPVDEKRGYTLAIRWIINSAINRSEKTMITKLTEELIDASNGKGAAIKKREDTHKMAEANKAFAHFSPKKISK